MLGQSEPLDKIKTRSTQDKHLTVHIIPHTHDDVGWQKTVEEYYTGAQPEVHASVEEILDSVTKELAKDKRDKHEAKCVALDYDFLPAAFTSFGGWGEAIMKVLTKEYHARKKQEKKSGGSGWESQRWKQDLLERMSVAIAKGNLALLDAHSRVPVAA